MTTCRARENLCPPRDDPQNAVFDRILKANGAVPEPVSLMREMSRLRAQLANTADRSGRRRILQDLSLLQARLDIARKCP
ncbi:hypothetical protein ATI53_1001168 [Salipiger aestuarii]|uniref:Uncharacterized protein n=1 Tax=Salipiger aestuarii TaxID=568098 RepID=A0A327YU35_9RHOB|nr:hypothetical protein ATI53_1001168 [Salipiger aestuarii]